MKLFKQYPYIYTTNDWEFPVDEFEASFKERYGFDCIVVILNSGKELTRVE